MADKTVLVTGAGGFIGSHLAEHLVGMGVKTRAFVHYNSAGSWGWLDGSPVKDKLEIVLGDVRDFESLSDAMRGMDVVFHLAALIGIPYSYRAATSYVSTNVQGTLNVLQAARMLDVHRIIHTSTSEVYGSARSIPISEDHPLQAQSPYAASKIGADKMVDAFVVSHGIPATVVRPFNTYGPRQSARAVIPTIVMQCLSETPTIRLGNLSPTRDLTYVSDTVEGFVAAAGSEPALGQTINLGSGTELSIGALARVIAEIVGVDAPVEEDPARVRVAGSEVERLCSDNSKAGELLGWRPAVDLRDGLERTVDWMRSHAARYRPRDYVL